MKNFWFLFSAYMVIWVAIFGYILKLNGKMKELKLKLDKFESETEEQ